LGSLPGAGGSRRRGSWRRARSHDDAHPGTAGAASCARAVCGAYRLGRALTAERVPRRRREELRTCPTCGRWPAGDWEDGAARAIPGLWWAELGRDCTCDGPFSWRWWYARSGACHVSFFFGKQGLYYFVN